MKKPEFHTRHSAVPYHSYIAGFVLSIVTTLMAFYAVVNKLWEPALLIPIVLAIAVAQLIIQVVFFLHIGRGSRWKLMTFIFTILVVAIIVVGSIWIMNNLNYNMMDMTPAEQQEYMSEHQGI